MKRARSEQMQALILSYLKKRNYADSETTFKFDFKFEESIKAMASRVTEEADFSSSLNPVSLTAFSIDEYFSSFEDFKHFAGKTAMGCSDITDILYPVFCHMYLDLVMAGRKSDAVKFLSHFENDVFSRSKECILTFKELSLIIQPSDVLNPSKVREFRRKKYIVNMSRDSQALLLRYLQADSSLLVIKVINLHIHVNVVNEGACLYDLYSNADPDDNEVLPDLQSDTKKQKKEKEKISDSKTTLKQDAVILSAPSMLSPSTPLFVDPSLPMIPEVDANTLHASIQSVYETKPMIGNVCLHRLQNAGSIGLTHVTLSNKLQLLCTGHEDSTARLWNFTSNSSVSSVSNQNGSVDDPKPFQKPDRCRGSCQKSPDVSKIQLACHFYDSIQERLAKNSGSDANKNSGCRCLRAHSGTVYASRFSHDDRYLLTSSEDTTVRLWDAMSCKNKVIYRGHSYPVWCIGMSSYSLYFASGSQDKTARLWTTERTFPVRTFAGHHGDVECVEFHGNASYLASADKTIRLWDLGSGKTVRLMLGHWASVGCLAFSPSGKYLASSGEDGRVRMWDIGSGVLIKEFRGHNGMVYSLDFSQDGSMLASGGLDSNLFVWNTRTSQSPNTRNNTDTDDPNQNPDLIGKWNLSAGSIHTVKFEACNLLHCIVSER